MSELQHTDPVQVHGHAYDLYPPVARFNAGGYGGKISTPYRIRYGNRWHRVYMMCYGNGGTTYIVKGGNDLILDLDTEYALSDGHTPLVGEFASA